MQIEDVEKLAELARIEMAAEEKEEILKDLQGILGYVDQVRKAPVETGEGELKVKNVLREDNPQSAHAGGGGPHETGIYTEKLLAEATDKQDNYVKVKKIL